MNRPPIIIVIMILATVIITSLIDRSRAQSFEPAPVASHTEKTQYSQTRASSRDSSPLRQKEEKVTWWDRKPFPFASTQEKGGFKWTAEDGMSPEIMRQLANNNVMLKSLEEENASILRRQLIYAPENFGKKAQKIYDETLKTITLPGFDGRLFEVEISTVTPKDAKEVSGAFAGKLVGQEGWVTAASEKDYWSIGIYTSDQVINIANREHGEWMLSEGDPNAKPEQDCNCCLGGIHHFTADSVGAISAE